MDKTALFTLSCGLYVIGVKNARGFGGRVLDAFMQVTDGETPIVAASFMNAGDAVQCVKREKAFAVSVLPQEIAPFVLGNFGYQSGANTQKWANVPHDFFEGLPTLRDCIARLYCRVTEIREYDTHTLCLCTVENAEIVRKAEPLIYADYHKTLKAEVQAAFAAFQADGSVPESNLRTDAAETPQEAPAEATGGKWVCTLCGYVYDGETPFEELPEDWSCPLCGAPKNVFEFQE